MAKGITVPVVQSGLEASIEAAAKKAGPLTLSATVDPSSFKRLAQPLGRVSGLATEFEKSIAASNARVIAFGASVGIINGVQNAFASLVKTTIEVEKSLTNIAVISGKTTDELQPFSRALFEIAKNTSQSFQTASEAALEFSRQGLSLEETLKRTQDALTLTRFTTLSAAEAVDVLTAAANSFGATGITTSEILNKLVAVDTKFAVSAEDLAKGLSRAGSIAQEVGVNFDELNAIVTIAQERTARGGAVIGNAFKTIFTRIRSDETIQALQSIGIYSFDAEGRLKPVVGLLEELAGKINTLGETKRIEVLEAIASKYNINVLAALVDDLGSTTSKFAQARDISAGAQNEAYQRQIEFNKTLDAVITRVTNSAAQLADTLGRIGVTDSLKSLLNFFDNILTGINDVIDSEGIGGTIAKGLISGLSGVFFKIGIPLLLAIFVKLTRDIAQFGVESLKTILGINKEVRERQALEQAVVNTLIKDQQVMASILSLSGDRRKQEEYLLSVYNRQLASLQQVQTIAAGVAPALQAAGLSATSGTIKKRAAGGYLPAEEAKDVRRGVGGASPSSKVVEIPNFSFGGGKRGTMVANTSEYIVPNYANGSGTAIFNQDMVKQYGLPPGAKKITASGGFVPASGFVPNFAAKKFNVFDRLRNVKKNADPIDEVSIEGMQKSAYLTLGDKVDPVGRFSELQTSAKQRLTDKLGEIASNAKIYTEQGKIEFVKINDKFNSKDLYEKVKVVSNKKRNKKKIEDSDIDSIVSSILPSTEGSIDEDVRASIRGDVKKTVMSNSPDPFKSGFALEDVLFKKFTGIAAAKNNRAWDLPARQSGNFKKTFGFSSEFGDIKSGTSVSSISSFIGKHINAPTGTNASRGYIPNFAELNDKGIYAGLVGETAPDKQSDVQRVTKYVTPTEKGVDIYDTGIKSADSVTFDLYRVPKKNEFKLKSIREALGNTGKNLAIDLAREVTGGALGNNVAEQKLTQTFNPGSLQSFASTIFEASVGALLSDKSFQDYTEQSTTSLFDLNIAGNSLIKKNFGIKDSVNALEVKGASTPKLLNSIAEKIYKVTAGGQEAFTKRTRVYLEDPNRSNKKKVATAFIKDGVPFVETAVGVFEPKKEGFDASQYELLKKPKIGAIYKTGALGYVPNYVSERAKAAIDRLKKQGATSGEMQAAEAAEARIRGRESAIPRSLLTLDDEKFLETQGGSIEKAMGFGLNPILQKLQSIRNNEELQNSDSTQIKSLKEKIGTVNLQRVWKMIGNQESRRLQVQKTLIEKRYPTRIQGAALGFVPNFADSDASLEASINGAAKSAYGQFSKKKITAGVSKNLVGSLKEPGTKKFREVLNSGTPITDFIGLQAATIGVPRPNNDLASLRFFNRDTNGPRPALRAVTANPDENEVLAPASQFYDLKTAIGFAKAATVSLAATPVGKRAAKGFVPNFVDNEPLNEAINREVGAGVSPARVRVTQDRRLKNPKNPNGLAVINTRDEPNGKIPNDFRERGMRAAMASRGFVPNFAEGVSLKGSTKFTTETQDIMGGAPISAPFPKEELAKLRKVLNEAVAAYEAEIKAGKDLEEAKKKLNEATNKATSQANLSKESASKVQSAVAKTAGAITPEKKNDSKGIDIGKFLVLQTAIVGATSALQAFTEQNSTAANAIDGVNAGLSGLATFAALATSVNLPLRIFISSLTALASAAPLLSRFFESQKTPAEKAAESLAKLADEAEKTGKALSPEAILAAFENEQQTNKNKEEVKSVSSQVRDYLKAQYIEATDQQVKILSASLLANPQGVQREGGFAKKINEQELGGLLAQTTEKVEVKKGLKRGSYNTEINEGKLAQEAAKKSREQVEAAKRRLANTQDLSKLTEEEKKKIQEANETENARQKVLNSLFAAQLRINSDYEKSLRASNNIVAALERQKGLLTEAEFITAKGNQERAKAQAEFDKTNKLIIEDLKKSLGAGSNESILGPNAQKFFNTLNPQIIENLLTEFEKGGGNVDQSNTAFKAFVDALKAAGANVEGLTDLSVLGPKGSGNVRDTLRAASQSRQQAQAQKENADANTTSATANELASTELRKLQGATAETTAILEGTSGIIAGTGQRFNGIKKYTELLGIEQEKYRKSIVDLKLKNQLEIDSAEDKIEAEMEGTELRNQHSALMRKILGVDRAAEMAASNLVEETSKRVFDLASQAKNAGLKLNTDIEVLDAETNLINAYNEVYKGSIQEDDARSKLANALAKAERSEQEKDTELKVQIGLIRKSWETEGKDIERKIELAEKRAILIKDIDYSKRAELELRSEALNLAEARRKAAANLEKNNLDLSVRNKIISNETRNLEEIKNIITEGRALTTAGVESSFEQQARAAVVERRLAGRKNVDLRESTNILTGRDNSIQQNLEIQKGVLLDQAETFQQIIGNQTPKLFADGMAEAMQAALNQADDLGGALRNVALNFLKSLQSAFLQSASRQIVASILPTGAAKGGYVQGYAAGGLVTGGSGYKDDVPAMLSEGEYVIRKSSVKKYGASNLQKLNSGEAPKFAAGGIFLPGIRGQTEISGYKDLTAFAKQTTTSGATDVLAGGATTAFANLEDQSSRLSAYALMREDDTINQEIRSAQEQAMNIIAEREAYRTAERKAFQKQLIGTIGSAALSYGVNAGVGKLGSLFNSAAPVPKEMSNLINDSGFDYSNFGNIGYQAAGKTVDQGLSFGNFADGAAGVLKSLPSYQAPRTQSIYSNTRTRMLGSKGYPFMAYGGAVKRYNAGGPTDDIPALLMGGEYVMNRQATKKYGRQFFDSINQGRAPRFADGGNVSTAEPSFAEKAASSSDSKATGATNVSININVTGGTSDTQTQGDTKQGGVDYKKMSEQIKQVVIQTINEEKRLGGSLRPRG